MRLARLLPSVMITLWPLSGQIGGGISNPGTIPVTANPSGSCTFSALIYNTTSGGLYGCASGTYAAISGGGGATGASGPSGPAGAAGATGPSGPSGPSGAAGSAGATGATGPSGPSGPGSAPGAPDGALQYRVNSTTLGGMPIIYNPLSSDSLFFGSGLNDCSVDSSAYTGSITNSGGALKLTIDSEGTPDQVTWQYQDASQNVLSSGGPTAITGAAQATTAGITFTCSATTGHTATDYWLGTTSNLQFPFSTPWSFPALAGGISKIIGINQQGLPTTVTLNQSSNKVVCWRSDATFGFCSDAPAMDGSCTCN